MRVVSAGEIDGALSFPALIDALAAGFAGDIAAPTRHHHAMARAGGDATLLLMPAWTPGDDARLGVKIVTVFPENGAKSLATVIGTYLLMDGTSGVPLAAMDGTRLTLWRTAAASALAARHLAAPDASRLVMVGAGALAPFLIRAHMSVRPIRHVTLWNHRPDKAEALAGELAAQGLPVTSTGDLESATREADIVSCATLSRAALVRGEWLKDGAHLDLVGAFAPGMREVDDDALRRAAIFIDTKAAITEGGDVEGAIRSRAISAATVRADLRALVTGGHPGRSSPTQVTLFKSVGAALEDLVAADLVWRVLAA